MQNRRLNGDAFAGGVGVYPKTAFPVAGFKRSMTVGMDVRTWLRNSVGNSVGSSRSTTVGIRRSIERNITRNTWRNR
jgi:hypothetical protein